jgi:hypothetical protein
MPDDTTETYTATTLVKKLAEVLESWPLYRRFQYTGENLYFVDPDPRVPRGQDHVAQLPKTIRQFCGTEDCQSSQLWELADESAVYLSRGFQRRTYRCRNCKNAAFTYFFLWNLTEDHEGGVFTKVGQWPPLSHEPPRELQRRLDKEDYQFYVKALDCRNFNYGLAAVAYMRRVVENKTNDLLDLIAETLQAEGASPEELNKILEIKKSTVYEDKLDVAQKVLPARLVREGSNPIKNLYSLTSQAMHEKSEEECIDIFDHGRAAFEYVFIELEVERARAEDYTKTMRALNEKAKPKPSPTQTAKKAS